MRALNILIAARKLLSSPKRWTQEVYAKGKSGSATKPTSRNAVCWCMIGALQKVSRNDEEALWSARKVVESIIGNHIGIAGLNDSPRTTHADVLRVLDAAIDKARADG